MPILSGLVLGQITTFISLYAGIATLCFQVLLFGLRSGFFLGGLLGEIGVASLLPTLGTNSAKSNKSYLVKVDDTVRYRRVGEIEVPIAILGEVKKSEDHQLILLNWRANPRYLCKGIHLPWRNISKVKRGDTLVVRGAFSELSKAREIFSYHSYLWRQGFYGTCKIEYSTKILNSAVGPIQKMRQRIRKLTENVLGFGEVSGMPLSTSLGIKDVLSIRTEEAFRRTGLTHVLVVSGYQVTLIYGVIYLGFISFCSRILPLVRRMPATFIAIPASLFSTGIFVLLVEPDGPVLRAWVALTLCSLSSIFERGKNQVHSLLVGLFLLSVLSPGCYLDPGVELSFAALSGLFLGAQMARSNLGKFLASSLAASALTGFVCAIRFGGFSITSLLINPWLAPVFSIVGCKLVLVGISVHALGIDSQAYVLKGSSEMLLFVRDLVVELSSIEYGYWEGVSAVMLGVSSLVILLFFSIRISRRSTAETPSQRTVSWGSIESGKLQV